MAQTAVTQTQTQTQSPSDAPCLLQGYDPNGFFCETMRRGQPPHPGLDLLRARLAQFPVETLRPRAAAAENDLLDLGITFTVYSDASAIDRILPFDCIPRVLTAAEWRQLEAGVKQRVAALNLSCTTSTTRRKIIAGRRGAAPTWCSATPNYRPEMANFDVSASAPMCTSAAPTSCATRPANSCVLEDNARTPSGVVLRGGEPPHDAARAFPT